MSESNQMHWVENDEILDRYLRGAISDLERARLERHLADCPSCTQRLSEERRTVEGIRSYAREDLRDDLRRLLETRSLRRRVTYRWLAAAATIVLAVAVWYIPGEPPPPPVLSESAFEKGPEPAVDEKPAEVMMQPPPEATGRAADDRQKETPAAAPAELPVAGREDARGGIASKDVTAGAEERVEQEDAMLGRAVDVAGRAASTVPAGAGQAGPDSWTIATLIDESDARAEEAGEGMAAFRDDLKSRMKKKSERQIISDPSGIVSLSQEPIGRARADMQRRTVPGEQLLPVRVRETADTLYITLYPETLWPESVLQRVTVDRSGPDSIFLRIGGQQLRLPRHTGAAVGQ